MIYRFDPNEYFIAITVDLVVPGASCKIVMALDTGATQTVVDENVLAFLGLSPPNRRLSVNTANGSVWVDEFRLDSLRALGCNRTPMDVIAMDLRTSDYEGMLGKDFFRDRVLKIDFLNGTIEVN